MNHTLVTTKSCMQSGCDNPVIVTRDVQNHEYDDGVLSDDYKTIIYTCKCGHTKTEEVEHKHDYSVSSVKYEDITDDLHTKIITSLCNIPGCDEPILIYSEPQAHTFDNGTINDSETQITYTCECGYTKTEAITHVHSDAPANLNYSFMKSNNDGSHSYSATYICEKCGEEVTVTKNEDCIYSETIKSIGITNPNNVHDVVSVCDVCSYEGPVRQEPCVKIGDMKYIKIGSYIYEYYDCDLCKGYVDRDFHTDHQFGEWEINDNYHIRYCGCVEAREKGDHEFIKTQDPNDPSKTIALCTVCGFAKPTLDHEHAPDGIDLWDLIFTDWYHDIIRQNITNPNPSLDDYCYRYDYLCSICGEEYSSYYTHKFENGICRRNGCGVLDPDYQIIEEPQELDNSSSLFEENETNAMTLSRKMDIPGNNGYYY